MNEVMLLAIVGAVVFVGILAWDPTFAKWVASVIFARALAVEAGREQYRVARAAGLELGTRVEKR